METASQEICLTMS